MDNRLDARGPLSPGLPQWAISRIIRLLHGGLGNWCLLFRFMRLGSSMGLFILAFLLGFAFPLQEDSESQYEFSDVEKHRLKLVPRGSLERQK